MKEMLSMMSTKEVDISKEEVFKNKVQKNKTMYREVCGTTNKGRGFCLTKSPVVGSELEDELTQDHIPTKKEKIDLHNLPLSFSDIICNLKQKKLSKDKNVFDNDVNVQDENKMKKCLINASHSKDTWVENFENLEINKHTKNEDLNCKTDDLMIKEKQTEVDFASFKINKNQSPVDVVNIDEKKCKTTIASNDKEIDFNMFRNKSKTFNEDDLKLLKNARPAGNQQATCHIKKENKFDRSEKKIKNFNDYEVISSSSSNTYNSNSSFLNTSTKSRSSTYCNKLEKHSTKDISNNEFKKSDVISRPSSHCNKLEKCSKKGLSNIEFKKSYVISQQKQFCTRNTNHCKCDTCNEWTFSNEPVFRPPPENTIKKLPESRIKEIRPTLLKPTPDDNIKIDFYKIEPITQQIEKFMAPKVIMHTRDFVFPAMTIQEAHFHKLIRQSLYNLKYKVSQGIQAYVWPTVIRHEHVVIVNGRNTGKKIAYLPAICSNLLTMQDTIKNDSAVGPAALILVPSVKVGEKVSALICKLYRETKNMPKIICALPPLVNRIKVSLNELTQSIVLYSQI